MVALEVSRDFLRRGSWYLMDGGEDTSKQCWACAVRLLQAAEEGCFDC